MNNKKLLKSEIYHQNVAIWFLHLFPIILLPPPRVLRSFLQQSTSFLVLVCNSHPFTPSSFKIILLFNPLIFKSFTICLINSLVSSNACLGQWLYWSVFKCKEGLNETLALLVLWNSVPKQAGCFLAGFSGSVKNISESLFLGFQFERSKITAWNFLQFFYPIIC